jgi:hypothetical protein
MIGDYTRDVENRCWMALVSRSSIVHHINHSSTLLNSSIDPDSQNLAGHRRSQVLEHISPRVVNSPHCLALSNILERLNIELDPSAVQNRHARNVRRLVRLGQIHGNGCSHVGSLGRVHLQVVDQAVDEVLRTRNERAVPVFCWADFEGDGWDAVVHPGSLDTAGLTGIDLDNVGLRELREALDAGEGKVGVGP